MQCSGAAAKVDMADIERVVFERGVAGTQKNWYICHQRQRPLVCEGGAL